MTRMPALTLVLSDAERVRFMAKVGAPDGLGCTPWLGARNRAGYGFWHTRGRQFYAHRIAWVMVRGTLPANHMICHSCDNPSCVNPAHLVLGDAHTNMADMVSKGRAMMGSRAHFSKLNADQVREIRKRHEGGESTRRLAREFGIANNAAWEIVVRKSWGWLE